MNPIEMATALKYLMGKLSEADLAELDAQLAEGTKPEPLAMDAKKQSWLALDSSGRHALRKSRIAAAAKYSAEDADFVRRFPDTNRLG